MAIYSLNHKHIGKTSQRRPNTAAAHVQYINRKEACTHIDGERMPIECAKTKRWFNAQEVADRKNARVADKVMLALPKELNAKQRHALVRDFAESLTEGKASWLAAFHDKGKDEKNPHCHLVLRDRDVETGKRVMQMSERGSTERLRVLWEEKTNAHLSEVVATARVSRKSLKEQGIDRTPTLHEGPQGREMQARGARPASRVRRQQNGITARSKARSVDYRDIDAGRTRSEYNKILQKGRFRHLARLAQEKHQRTLSKQKREKDRSLEK